MCLDLVTPSQSLIELSACFLLQCIKKKGMSCRFKSLSSAVLWKQEETNSFSSYVADLECQ